jgi:hypothetical protein
MPDSCVAIDVVTVSVFSIVDGLPWGDNGLWSSRSLLYTISSSGLCAGIAIRCYWGYSDSDCANAIAIQYHRPARETPHVAVIS